jgi:hypothetical protein
METLINIHTALANFQGEISNIEKSKTVKVTTAKGSYNFNYAPHDVIIEACRPVLAKNGLSITQEVLTNRIETTIRHISGEFIISSLPFPTFQEMGADKFNAQAVGSWLTYMRRYSYTLVLGIATEDDDDGNVASGNHVDTVKEIQRVVKALSPAIPCERCGMAMVERNSAKGKFWGCSGYPKCANTISTNPAQK